MPIILSENYQPGSADKEAKDGYGMCQLTSLWHNPMTMAVTLSYEFGTASGDHYEIWERGKGAPTQNVDVSGAEVVGLWGQMPKDGECVGQAIRRLTYEWLIDQGIAVGTIADAPPLPPAQTDATASATTAEATSATEPAATATASTTDDTAADASSTDSAASSDAASS